MRIAIVFSSATGNTAQVAEAIKEACGGHEIVAYGQPPQNVDKAELVFAGSWTDKGTCTAEMKEFLQGLHGKRVALFGTAGFGGAPAYFAKILAAAQAHVPASAHVLGSFMCQGKMPQAVRQRYEAMEDSPRRTAMLENFDKALSHPDQQDLDRLKAAVAQ